MFQVLSILLFGTMPFVCTYAQKEMNTWYFGVNAGLDFSKMVNKKSDSNQNAKVPTYIPNGSISTSEGCFTISDSEGNLLMSSDGTTVYNKNATSTTGAAGYMQNGTGLLGNASATHQVLLYLCQVVILSITY